jgi:uncharacterized membrane protein (UPF0127 family)
VEIAKSYRERMKGLSGRARIGSDGLLFVFQREAKHSIWMPNMKFPIDIIYINKSKKIVDIKHEAKPITVNPKTWRIFRPKNKAKYILEIPANSAKTKHKLKIGDILSL